MRKLLCAILWATLLSAVGAQPVVVISIDGLNPAFYSDGQYQTPNLKALARGGAAADSVAPVFPSFTYPNHTTLVTGCRPDRHGVHTNIIEDGPDWYWESRHIKTPTLWQVAKSEGLTVACLSWPVTVGAQVDYLIPEIFQVKGQSLSTEQLLNRHSTPGLLQRFEVRVPDNFREWDIETAKVATGLLQEQKLDLMLVHLIQVDKAQHDYGPEHDLVKQAIARVDILVRQIVEAAGSEATIVIAGDHGFQAYDRMLYPNGLLREQRLQNLARVKTTGGSMAVYTESDKVLELFRAQRPGVARVIEEQELHALGAFPGARLALVAEPGYIFSRKTEGSGRTERTKGQHGYLPGDVPTGLIIHGPGLAPGTSLGNLDITQVAPTLAFLLGLRLPSAQGSSILETVE